jgi:hypothetical protein
VLPLTCFSGECSVYFNIAAFMNNNTDRIGRAAGADEVKRLRQTCQCFIFAQVVPAVGEDLKSLGPDRLREMALG